MSYTFLWHDCAGEYNFPVRQPDPAFASLFTRTNVGCHTLEGPAYPQVLDGAFGTRSWPTTPPLDLDKSTGFTLTASSGYLVEITPTDSFSFWLSGATALDVIVETDSQEELVVFQLPKRTEWGWQEFTVSFQESIKSEWVRFRFHAYDTITLVGFDSINLTFGVIASVANETIPQAGFGEICSLESIYPNPSSGAATVQFRSGGILPVLIRVTDVLGKVWVTQVTEVGANVSMRVNIGLGNPPPGTYFVSVSCAPQSPLKWVIVN